MKKRKKKSASLRGVKVGDIITSESCSPDGTVRPITLEVTKDPCEIPIGKLGDFLADNLAKLILGIPV